MATRDAQGQLTFSLDDLRAILRRRRWWFAIPAAIGALVSLGLALGWPAQYEAASIVVIQPQGVPEQLVATTVSSDTESRYGQIKLQILARDNLSTIIDKFGLYADRVESTPREELVESMREWIAIEPLPPAIVDPRKPIEIQSFRIAFRGPDPEVVAGVANQLTSDFLVANLRERREQAEGTSEFINAELGKTEEERGRVLQDLMEYRQQHQGALPADLRANQARRERLDQTQRDTHTRLELGEQQVAQIRRQIRELRMAGADGTADPVVRRRSLELLINQYQAQGKTEKHPDLVIARAELAQLEIMLAERVDMDAPLSPAEASLRNEIRNHEVQVRVLRGRLTELEDQIAEVEARIASTPQHSAEVGQLEAVIMGLSEEIRELQRRKIAADLGQSVELVEKGEKFRVVETAVAPSSPVFPNRPLFFIVGLFLGISVGLLLMIMREMTDSSFHTIQDLQSELDLPVLAAIPVIELPAEKAKRRERVRRAVATGALILAVAAGGSLVVYLYQNADEIRAAIAPAPEAAARV